MGGALIAGYLTWVHSAELEPFSVGGGACRARSASTCLRSAETRTSASFLITNEGSTTHGMAMALQPVKADGGTLDDAALLNKGKELAGGESETVSFDLEPGSYELVCFVPGHYAAGQKLAFEAK